VPGVLDVHRRKRFLDEREYLLHKLQIETLEVSVALQAGRDSQRRGDMMFYSRAGRMATLSDRNVKPQLSASSPHCFYRGSLLPSFDHTSKRVVSVTGENHDMPSNSYGENFQSTHGNTRILTTPTSLGPTPTMFFRHSESGRIPFNGEFEGRSCNSDNMMIVGLPSRAIEAQEERRGDVRFYPTTTEYAPSSVLGSCSPATRSVRKEYWTTGLNSNENTLNKSNSA
ncbi:MAG: hypothetical protein ACRDL7_14220, partial [Gaiellaceae bacterium]